jgi:diadenosine tetraphosphate (Ap4A) HIT family hydrolase
MSNPQHEVAQIQTLPGPIANRVERIKAGNDPEFIAELPSGYAILGKYQPEPITGCCMLLPKVVVPSPNDLDHTDRAQFFSDLVLLGDAIMQVTGSERINYLVLCNQVPELHGHCIPRFETEDPTKRMQGPFEAYDFGNARVSSAQTQDKALHASLKSTLQSLLSSRSSTESRE